MGYEVKMYLVEKFDHMPDHDGTCYASVLASVDLCKIGRGEVVELDARHPAKPEVYIYGSDGNTRITMDCYDHPLRIIDPQTFLKALQTDNKREAYRRYQMAIALLKATIPAFGKELKVLLYGH